MKVTRILNFTHNIFNLPYTEVVICIALLQSKPSMASHITQYTRPLCDILGKQQSTLSQNLIVNAKSNTTDATLGFLVLLSLVFCVMLCRTLFVRLPFFDLRLLITHLVSSNFSSSSVCKRQNTFQQRVDIIRKSFLNDNMRRLYHSLIIVSIQKAVTV